MNPTAARAHGLGVFRVHWTTGGTSVASVYMDSAGVFWLAPSNWTWPAPLPSVAKMIERMTKLRRA